MTSVNIPLAGTAMMAPTSARDDVPIFPAPKTPAGHNLRWSETLRDRSHVLIRPFGAGDHAAKLKFAETVAASPENAPIRMHGHVANPERLSGEQAVHERERTMTFVAIVREDSQERIVGISEYRSDERGLYCECTVVVDEEWRRKGLGTLLMRHLIEIARERGIRYMRSSCSAENTALSDLAHFLGFRTRLDPDDPLRLVHELSL